jgi:hypothetical protein
MNSSKKLAAIFALAVSAGFAGTGCMAQSDGADETEAQHEMTAPADQKTDANNEKTGEAAQKCFGGFGGWGGFGGFGGGWGCGFGGPCWGGPWGALGGGWGGCW